MSASANAHGFLGQDQSKALLQIGEQLDEDAFPEVADGGFVVLREPVITATRSAEINHERESQRRSATGSWPGTPGWQGASRGARSAGDAAQVVGADLQTQVEEQLSGLQEQYPGAQLHHQSDGAWLLTESRLLPGLRQYAIFLTGISFRWRLVRSWGFWGDPLAKPIWIGPRHTNYHDGAVCAYEPTDRTWVAGDPLVQLLDLYSLWALRHLYLLAFDRWPGRQAVHRPCERILELKPDEFCGCQEGLRAYSDCCMKKDLAVSRVGETLKFFWAAGGFRAPPKAVTEFMRNGAPLPNVCDLIGL